MERVVVDTARIRTHCFVQGPEDGIPVLLIHGNLTTGRFWQDVTTGLPGGYRVVAPDLRGFGRTEAKPIDATRGLRDWSDDLHALVEALGWAGSGRVHAAGWSNGGGVLQQYAIDHGQELASILLVAPLSPYGFGGTKDVEGTPCYDDYAGSGAGTAAPDFVRRLAAGDDSEEEPVSSPRVVMRTFFWSPAYKAPDEDELIAEVLLTAVGDTAYPGDLATSPNWPGVAPGVSGVNNAFSARWCDTSAFAGIADKPPVLWLRGDADQVISDQSMFDFGTLGSLGAVPGWPGPDVFPPQPHVSQMRAVLDRYADGGGALQEVVLEGCGHGPLVERAAEVRARLLGHIENGERHLD
ncbi:MAG TPA: alpha/beta hydrolase [Actinomycetes bacterium]|nr:alpha/beta hydrolase [Actinomycetes bacterium]